jgi:hypothetical protein
MIANKHAGPARSASAAAQNRPASERAVGSEMVQKASCMNLFAIPPEPADFFQSLEFLSVREIRTRQFGSL